MPLLELAGKWRGGYSCYPDHHTLPRFVPPATLVELRQLALIPFQDYRIIGAARRQVAGWLLDAAGREGQQVHRVQPSAGELGRLDVGRGYLGHHVAPYDRGWAHQV